jgi:hypothetical protein
LEAEFMQKTVDIITSEDYSRMRGPMDLTEAALSSDDNSVLAPRERRAAPRLACEGIAEVIVLGGALRFSGFIRDLSASGCCLTTEVAFTLERGTQLEMILVVNQIQFRVAGGVRSNHKIRGIGLEFVNVSARCRRLIQDLIAELQETSEWKAKIAVKADDREST